MRLIYSNKHLLEKDIWLDTAGLTFSLRDNLLSIVQSFYWNTTAIITTTYSSGHKNVTHENVNILVIYSLNPTILDIFKNLITLAVKKCPRSLNLINNWPRNWKNKFMKVFKQTLNFGVSGHYSKPFTKLFMQYLRQFLPELKDLGHFLIASIENLHQFVFPVSRPIIYQI